MRYIYYVVAALIFLAVVNLAASFIGNDTQELLTELNPDQPTTEAADQASPEATAPPVVGLDAGAAETEVPAEQQAETSNVAADVATADVATTDVASSDVVATEVAASEVVTTKEAEVVTNPAEQALASNSIDQATQSVQAGIVDTAEASGSEVAASIADVENVVETAAATEVAAPVAQELAGAETVVETTAVQEQAVAAVQGEAAATVSAAAETASEPVAETTAVLAEVDAATTTSTSVTQATEVATPQTQESTSQATTAVAAAVATTVATKLATKPKTTESTPQAADAVDASSQAEVAAPQPAATIAAVPVEAEKVTEAVEVAEAANVVETAEPSLIQSLGDSAGSAATAVVGGAQQAVETVVEAARSLIDPGDSADTEDKTTEAAAAAETTQPIPAEPAVALAANTTTSKAETPAIAEQPAAETQASKTVASAPQPLQATVESTPAAAEAVPAPQAPAQTAVAPAVAPEAKVAPVIAPVAKTAPKPAVPQVSASPVTRDLTIAPPEVLELVNRHPGKVLMIGFFSPNCRDCKPSLSWLNEMRRKYWAQGLQVIGVNLGTQAQAKAYLQDAPVSFEILHDPERKLASAFWLAKQPSTYLVNGSGKLLSTHQGHSPSRIGEYEDAIRIALEQR